MQYDIDTTSRSAATPARSSPRITRMSFTTFSRALMPSRLRKSHILTPGGGRSPICAALDGFLHGRGWHERPFDIRITIDEKPVLIPTHNIDNFKNDVELEVECTTRQNSMTAT